MGGYFAGAIAVIFLMLFYRYLLLFPLLFIQIYEKFYSILFGIVFIFIFSLLDWLKGNILGLSLTSISSLWSFNSDVLFPFSIFEFGDIALLLFH